MISLPWVPLKTSYHLKYEVDIIFLKSSNSQGVLGDIESKDVSMIDVYSFVNSLLLPWHPRVWPISHGINTTMIFVMPKSAKSPKSQQGD